MDNISSGYLSKRGPLPLHIWSKRFFVLETPKGIELDRLRLVHDKNLQKRKPSSSPAPSTKEFESLNADLFRSLSAATVSAHGFLAYYKSNTAPDLVSPLGLIDLSKVKMVEVVCRKVTKDYVVSLKTGSKNHLLAAANMTQAKAWETSIKERMASIADEPNVEETAAFKEVYEKLVKRTAFPKTASPSIQPANETTAAATSDAEPMTETDSEFEPVAATKKSTEEESKPTEETDTEVFVETVIDEVSVETETKVVEEVSAEAETKVVEEVSVEAETKVVEEVSAEAETKVVEEVSVEAETKVVGEVPVEKETKVVEEVSIETETKVVEEVPVETVEAVIADEPVEEVAVPVVAEESAVLEPTPRKTKRKSFLVTVFASMKKGNSETTEVVSEPTTTEVVPEETAETSSEEVPAKVSPEEPKPEVHIHSPLAEVKKAFNSFFYPKKKEPVAEPVAEVTQEEEHETTIVEESKPSEVSEEVPEHDEIARMVEEAVEAAATEIASKEEDKTEEVVVRRKRSIFLQLFRQKKVAVPVEAQVAPTSEEKETDVAEETAADVVEVATDAVMTEEVKVEVTPAEEEVAEAPVTETVVEVPKDEMSPLVRAFSKLFKVPRKVSVSEPAAAETVKETEAPLAEVTDVTETAEATKTTDIVVETEVSEVTEVVETVADPVASSTDEKAADVPAVKKRLNMMERINLFIGKSHSTEIPIASKEDRNVTIVDGDATTKKEE